MRLTTEQRKAALKYFSIVYVEPSDSPYYDMGYKDGWEGRDSGLPGTPNYVMGYKDGMSDRERIIDENEEMFYKQINEDEILPIEEALRLSNLVMKRLQ